MRLAEIYALLGEEEYDTALDEVNCLLISYPHSAEVLLCKSHILYAQRHLDLAEETVRIALSIAPDHARANFALLKMLQMRGNLAEAETVFATMLACPDFANTIDVESYALMLFASGHVQAAFVVFERGIYLRPTFIHLRIAYAHMLRQDGQLDNAARVYSEALQLDPENVQIIYGLGNLENERGNLIAALGHFQTAVRLYPNEARLRAEFTHTLLMVSFPLFRFMQQIMVYLERKIRDRMLWRKIGMVVLIPLIVAAILLVADLPLAGVIARLWLWGIGLSIGLPMFATAWMMLFRPIYVTLLWLRSAHQPYVAYHSADAVAASEWCIILISVLVLIGALPSLGSEHVVSRISIAVLCASVASITFSYGLRIAHNTIWFMRVGLAYATLIIGIYMMAIIIATNYMDRRLKIVAVFLFFFGMISFIIIGNKAQNVID